MTKPRIRLEKDVPISQYYLERAQKYGKRGDNHSRGGKVVDGNGHRNIYPFAKMQPGDSFVLPLRKVRNPKRSSKSAASESNYPYEMRAISKAYGEALNKTFLVLKDDNHQWRCYCVENEKDEPENGSGTVIQSTANVLGKSFLGNQC